MTARGKMTMRAVIERDVSEGTDDWGNPTEPDWEADEDATPCLMYVRAGAGQVGRVVIDTEKTAVLEDRRAIVPLDTDVSTADRIARVEDRAGTVLFAGPMGIDAVHRRRDHLELAVERIA